MKSKEELFLKLINGYHVEIRANTNNYEMIDFYNSDGDWFLNHRTNDGYVFISYWKMWKFFENELLPDSNLSITEKMKAIDQEISLFLKQMIYKYLNMKANYILIDAINGYKKESIKYILTKNIFNKNFQN